MRPDLQAALVCEDVRFEASGANTLVGVIQLVRAPQFPLRVMKLCVFCRWASGQGQFKQLTRILKPDESQLAATETQFQLNDEDRLATNIAVFGGVEFTTPGQYPVEILLDNDLILRFYIPIVQVNTPTAPGQN